MASLLLVRSARKGWHSVRQRWQRPVPPHWRRPPWLGWARPVGPTCGLIQARCVASVDVVVWFESGLARLPLLPVAHLFHLQKNSGGFANELVRFAAGNGAIWVVPVQRRQGPVQLGPSWRHANAMRRFWFGQRLGFVGPSVQIWWRRWGSRRILLFFVVRRSWLRRKLSERDLVKRHHSKHLQLTMLPKAQ